MILLINLSFCSNLLAQDIGELLINYNFKKITIKTEQLNNNNRFQFLSKEIYCLNSTGCMKSNSIVLTKTNPELIDMTITSQKTPHYKEIVEYDEYNRKIKKISSINVMPQGWKSDTTIYTYQDGLLISIQKEINTNGTLKKELTTLIYLNNILIESETIYTFKNGVNDVIKNSFVYKKNKIHSINVFKMINNKWIQFQKKKFNYCF